MPCDAWTLAHTLYLFESTLIDQDQTRIRRRVRKQGLEESCLYIVGTLMRGVMVQGARQPKADFTVFPMVEVDEAELAPPIAAGAEGRR